MAEFCLECFNEFWGKALKESEVKLSKVPELCESCSEEKHVVVRVYQEEYREDHPILRRLRKRS